MNQAHGYINEEKIVEAINEKTLNELNSNLFYFVTFLSNNLDYNIPLYSFRTENFIKPDICIGQGEKRWYISIKCGDSETLHTEQLNTFIDFLKSLGVDDYSIETYLLFHFGDGTTDGSGTVRLSPEDIRKKLGPRILQLIELPPLKHCMF